LTRGGEPPPAPDTLRTEIRPSQAGRFRAPCVTQKGRILNHANLWAKQGVLMHDQRVTASKVWVRLNEDDLARLTGKAAEASSLPTFASVRLQAGISRPGLWQLVRAGRYLAFRVPHRQTWQWHLKEVQPADKPKQPTSARCDRKGNTPYE
jgi:hypothetical protein